MLQSGGGGQRCLDLASRPESLSPVSQAGLETLYTDREDRRRLPSGSDACVSAGIMLRTLCSGLVGATVLLRPGGV